MTQPRRPMMDTFESSRNVAIYIPSDYMTKSIII